MRSKRKTLLFFLFFGLTFLLVSKLTFNQTVETEETLKMKEFVASYPNTTAKYRGVVAMDANLGCADEIYCDFGSNGLWVYIPGWIQLSALNPDFIISFTHGGTPYLLADFGSAGLWYWHWNGGWTPSSWVKISAGNAISAFATDDDADGDQELHVNFSGQGLWRYDMAGSPPWIKINSLNSSSNSLRMDAFTPGYEEGAHSFGSAGLWSYWWNFGNAWFKINANSIHDDNASAEFGIGDAAEELIIDFSLGVGLWLYDGSSWHILTSADPFDVKAVKFVGNADYELLACFSSAGLWWWNYSGYPGAWTKINAMRPDYDGGFCEPFDPNGYSEASGDEEVAVDFASTGLWLYDYTYNSWTKLSSNNPQFMVRCDPYYDGFDSALAVDFGTNGLWLYDGVSGSWTKINSLSPDGVI